MHLFDIPAWLEVAWPHVVAALTVLISTVASAHAVLHKRDVRAAAGWVGLAWLVPVLGGVLYLLLGINRIRRRARSLMLKQAPGRFPLSPQVAPMKAETVSVHHPEAAPLAPLVRLGDAVVGRPLLPGNRVTVLESRRDAYPAMLEAIDAARTTLSLCSYIFDNDVAGRRFVEALGAAVKRGVEVRVLVDAVGSRYTWPPILGRLRRAGVRAARFLPSLMPYRLPFANLRNHRKLLVVDGRVGFTGGMNIREAFWPGEHAAVDLHFRVEGPLVGQLQETFAEDWAFTTRERLTGEAWFPPLTEAGTVLARGIADGPDEDLETLRTVLLGALATARTSVRIVTPYFLPDTVLITALSVAALRGVQVDILLPQKGNLPLVQWATWAQLWQVLRPGCRIFLTAPPFDHTKLLVVDGVWSLIGSANWDPRSLRLNFEFNVECYDAALATQLEGVVAARLRDARPLTLEQVDARALPIRLRDGLARLLSPYL
ncbi:phosphatidylserine/phosphatidylglycerophosphate/cardiolipin synthase family protein [Myxococcus sp. AM010]|uniref:phospholipase D-like domain-containing protein n=1 Tax=Myxococcus sp. AM010 TaxID=2745138 RepID=UPI00159577AC|nr:phospholipase D-like domain-containing protein [Myxococcus sp. AM010]NVJ18114.1 PLDc N-terminal domain-containing protein [Myxococcus sp. AM010]